MSRIAHHRSRGVSLVEAMVALAVMAFGMLAVVGVQSTLRLNADIAAQRSEATLIAQAQLERDRSFTQVEGGAGSWSSIATDGAPVSVVGLNAAYSVRRTVSYDAPPAKVLSVTVSWNDRSGKPQKVTLDSSIAAAAPALSGTLAVRAGTAAGAPGRRPLNRHPSIPVQARDFGSRSAFVVPNFPQIAIVFNNLTGAVTSLCTLPRDRTNDNIAPSDIQSCADTAGQLLTGFIRFVRSGSGPDLTAADVEEPLGPVPNLRVRINLTSSGHPDEPQCFDDTTSTHASLGDLPFAAYYCVVFSNSSLLWSGRSFIEPLVDDSGNGWSIDDDWRVADAYRVCRYTTATSDGQTVPNTDHPRNYVNVSGNLTNQNFVVIRSTKHCPTDVAADPATGDFVNTNTLQHQPRP